MDRFRYRELPLLEQLLPLVEKKVTSREGGRFRAPFLKLLDTCSLAPVRDRANEELTEDGLVALGALFRALGSVLCSQDLEIQSAVADVLRKVVAGNDPTRPKTPDGAVKTFGECPDDLRPRPADISQALALRCGVVRSAVANLDKAINFLIESLADYDDASLGSSSFGTSDYISQDARLPREIRQADRVGLEAPPSPAPEVHDNTASEGIFASGGEHSRICADKEQGVQLEHRTRATEMGSRYSLVESLLHFVRELSTNASSSAAMVEAGLMSLLVQVLRAVRGIHDPIFPIAIEVLWNCLEHSQAEMKEAPPAESRSGLIRKARKRNAAFALSTWHGVEALRDSVETLLMRGFRKKDKELRNEAVIVASLLANNGRSHPLFCRTGALQLFLRYATAIEVGLAEGDPEARAAEARALALAADERSGGDGGTEVDGAPKLAALADPRNFATMTEVDLELKLLLWSLLADLGRRDSKNLQVIEMSPLMETLLMYMDLIVEEGPFSNSSEAGANRSFSLASMSSVDACLARSTQPMDSVPCDGAVAPQESGVDSPGIRDATQTSFSSAPSRPSDGHPLVGSVSDHRGREEPRLSVGNEGPVPVAFDEEGSAEVLPPDARRPAGYTRLYIPVNVVRLPLTSIQQLQGQAMASLLVLAPRSPVKFQALGGHMVTLRLLERLGSRPENHRLIKTATKMLATVVGLPGLKQELGQMDGVRIMLDRFSDGGGNREGRGDDRRGCSREDYGDLRADTVMILCRLCDQCPENQEAFRKAEGIPKMMAAIKEYCRARSNARQCEGVESHFAGAAAGGGERAASGALSMSSGQSRHNSGLSTSGGESLDPALVHIVDCIWCAVVGNRRSEARLLQCEGLDTLLDLLEVCPAVMRHQASSLRGALRRPSTHEPRLCDRFANTRGCDGRNSIGPRSTLPASRP